MEVPHGRGIALGAHGTIVGPARDAPHERLVVRFSGSGGEPAEEIMCDLEDVESAIAGDFRRGNAVIATRDLRVGGTVVVREGVLGTVVGPSSSDAQHRVTVSFSHREDGSRNRLNCVVSEIRLYVPGGLEVNARVQATRMLNLDSHNPVAAGTCGLVLGPAPEEPLERLLVRFETTSQLREAVEIVCRADDVTLVIAGGFRRGESVTAAKDLRVKGIVVVKQGVVGTVIGQSATDPNGRVTIAFARREDGRCNNLNVVPAEIQRTSCTGGLVPGDRVVARRRLLVVPRGSCGHVLGPSCARPSRVAVRFRTATDGDEMVLHVEPGDLRVVHAVGEDVSDAPAVTIVPVTEHEEQDTDVRRPVVAGGYTRGDAVVAARDLCVGGHIVVRTGVLGTVIGPSSQDPTGRVTVTFAWREDRKTNNLNVVPGEIKPVEPPTAANGELCAICLGELNVDGEELCRMPCTHVLHVGCVRAYLSHQTGGNASRSSSNAGELSIAALMPLKPAQCPVCRRDVLP
jgi:energy-converting hydrogenase Eha subunit E